MRKGLFAALFAAAAMMVSLVGCNQPKLPDSVAINNKEAMQEEWFGDNEARTLNLTVKKAGNEINALEAITKGDLLITSSNTSVATISGLKVNPVDGDGGKSTITVTYGEVSDNVEVTVTKANKHGKIPTDPFTVAEAIAVCEETGTTSTVVEYYVKGIVTKVNSAWSTQYENITFEIGDKKTDTKVVQCYRLGAGPDVDMDILKKLNRGSEVLVVGTLVNYKGTTPEMNQGGKVLSATEGDKDPLKLKGPDPLATVTAGTNYWAGAVQETINKVLFLDGSVNSSGYASTVAFAKTKANISLVADGSGFNLKFGNKFANLNSSNKLELGNVGSTIWTWVESLKTVKATVSDVDYYITVYSSYETFGASAADKCLENGSPKSGNFMLQFYAQTNELADPTAVQINQDLELSVGDVIDFTILANPFNADLSKLTWASSNEEIATAANGAVTGVGVGEAVITVTFGSLKDTCKVKINKAVKYEVDFTKYTAQYSGNNSYAQVYDVKYGMIEWKVPGNQSIASGLKLGGKLSAATDRALYSKTAIASPIADVVLTHGTKDTQITVNSLTLKVYATAEDAANDANPVSTVTGEFVDAGTTTFAKPADADWAGRFFRITYNMSSSAASSNKGIILAKMTFNYVPAN